VDTYSHGHHHSVLQTHKWRTAENSAAHLIPHLRPRMDLLDVGCGPGTITIDLAARVAPGRAVGVENVEAPLVDARAAAVESGVEVEFRLGDAYALDFEDDSFDVVHMHQVLHHLTDPVAALRELRRVVRPDGLVSLRETDYEGFAWYPASEGFDRWLATYLQLARGNGAEPAAGRRLRSWALEAGFSDVQSGASLWCFANQEDRDYWAGNWGTRVVESAFAQQAVERGLADRSDLEQMQQAFERWRVSPDGWFTVLHGEALCRP
jgi:ubiquinone/menaquinone biosynthesis C-methylase UbiE